MAKENQWGADPAKYKRLSKPVESREHAQVMASAFLADVAQLREKHRIPELTVQFVIYVQDGNDLVSLNGGAGWGDQTRQAQLAKAMFDREFDSLAMITTHLAMRMPKVRQMLLTNPDPNKPEIEDES